MFMTTDTFLSIWVTLTRIREARSAAPRPWRQMPHRSYWRAGPFRDRSIRSEDVLI